MDKKDDGPAGRKPLSSARQELLEKRLRGAGAARGSANPIPRRSAGGVLPLSFAQQRLWFLDQLEPGTAVYNVPSALELSGPLDIGALEKALTEIVRRHESLRTIFGGGGGQPVQIIGPPFEVRLPLVDLGTLGGGEKESEARRLAEEHARAPFDLAHGPLLRARLIRLSETEHRLLLTLHHIIADGWSIGLLSDEVTALYAAFAQGLPSPLPELPVQYADFAIWQRSWLSGTVLERELSYWKRKLSGNLPVIDLPCDSPRPAVRTHRGSVYRTVLPASLTPLLYALCKGEGVTLYMTLMAAFRTLLHRYSGQEDIIVGTAIAGRTRLETEKLIGFFVNTLPMRTQVSPDMTFRELLVRERRTALEAFEHQELPFERLVEEIRPPRDLSFTPVVQVMFALQNAPGLGGPSNGLRLETQELDTESAKFDLTLSITEKDRGMKMSLEYNADLFEGRTVAALAGHYRNILEGIVADPGQKLSAIPLLDAPEREQIAAWSGGSTAYPRDLCIHQLFAREAAEHPEAIALVYEGTAMSYAELDAQSDRLGRLLRAKGAGPDVPVGLCAGRSLQMIVGLLAILKAGGTYVPLDPALPADRLDFIMSDTGCRLILVHGERTPSVRTEGIAVIRIDGAYAEPPSASRDPLAQEATPENLAYVMYTSGSTGRPKGVMIPHRAVVRLVKGTDYCAFGREEVFLQFAPISFDASTFEIWGALLNGSRLVIAPARPPSFEELGCLIASSGVTTLWLTSVLFSQIVDSRPEALRGLKQLVTGGDVLSVPHVNRFMERHPETRLINGYGPTENTTFSCCHTVRSDVRAVTSVPIGRPIANSRAYVLDSRMNPVPAGVPGELYVGGDGLARGYLNDPSLTAERFVSDGARGRIYRTGDRVRFRHDGTIEFLGRLDNQVKIRGYRIEPGEIEAVLCEHPSVGNAAAAVREDGAGERRLIAWCVPRPQNEITAADLAAYLKRKLPEYMVPSAIVLLGSFPLSANGKVDRSALPAPDAHTNERPAPEEGEMSPAEAALAQIWSQILGSGPVGVHDNFFELGGHSLLAMQVISRVRDVFRIEIPLLSLFENPTVASLALVISEKLTEEIEKMSDEDVKGQG